MNILANEEMFREWKSLGNELSSICNEGASIFQNDMAIPMEDFITHMQGIQAKYEKLFNAFTILIGKSVTKVMLG